MNLFFEESGEFKTAHILTQVGEAFQVELPGGKRSKVRARDVVFQFGNPQASELMSVASQVAEEIDLDFLWEVAGQDEFDYSDLAKEYFGHDPLPNEAAGLLVRLHASPIYFYKKGKGRYKAAPEKSLKAALASIEKKKQQAIIQQQYCDQMVADELPTAIKTHAIELLCKPDKNSIEYKALTQTCDILHISADRLLLKLGAISGAYALHLNCFLFEHFPKGIAFPKLEFSTETFDLPQANVNAFSIDDITTTEIDDALSVTRLDNGHYKIGVHIAAPALGMTPGDPIDEVARHRLSTVYMPGDKITMLPDELVNKFTLGAGQNRPALSLYATVTPEDWAVIDVETKIEMICVSENLRHNNLEHLVTEQSLETNEGDYPHKDDIFVLWHFAQQLSKLRMAKRESFGLRPEQTNRVDFNFYVSEEGIVTIEKRKRTAPLDRIVAELMIFTNSSWGKLLNDFGIPGIYRSQGAGTGNWSNRMQVKMLTHAAPHQGLGVDQYAWSTSPLRRYTDLVNQWQILACLKYGQAAISNAPFLPKDASLFAIVSAFDSVYSTYGEFQSKMEKYWCLQWLTQHQSRQVQAVVLRDEVIRLVDIPLVIPMPGMRVLPRGSVVLIDLLRWDDVDLSVEARFVDEVVSTSEEPSLEQSENEEVIE